MSVPAAYVGVILVWATTPLAIKWSGEGAGFLFGVSSRMFIGALLATMLVVVMRLPFPWHKKARQAYVAVAMMLYGSMLCTYWAIQYLPSGLISVLFGTTPLVTAILAALMLREDALRLRHWIGIALGIAGLAIIFGSDVANTSLSMIGILAILLAVVIHSTSSVLIKRIDADVPALSLTAGGLMITSTLYLITWLLSNGADVPSVPERAAWAIVYLGVFGSVIGFVLFYYALKRVPANTMALITLITPMAALLLGNQLNGEPILVETWLGAGCIMLGLMIHQLQPTLAEKDT
ncbi:MAG: DMT family transporter [Proteobacteria bacterium]|nr:DMT family transporter [Pseudomonadota bacterium]